MIQKPKRRVDFNRKVVAHINCKKMLFDPSNERVKIRRDLYEIFGRPTNIIHKFDMVRDYFRAFYEGAPWYGISREDRLRLFKEGGGVCMWCGLPMSFSKMTIEHIVPRNEGGKDEYENYGISHAKCNHTRDGDKIDSRGYLKESLYKDQVFNLGLQSGIKRLLSDERLTDAEREKIKSIVLS